MVVHDSIINRVGFVMITLLFEVHIVFLAETEENGLRVRERNRVER